MFISNNGRVLVDFREGDLHASLDVVDRVTVTKITLDQEDDSGLYSRTLTIQADNRVIELVLEAETHDALRIFEERDQE